LGCIRYEELLDQYVATSAQDEAPRELSVFPTFEEALRAVELDAVSILGRREYAAEVRRRLDEPGHVALPDLGPIATDAVNASFRAIE
jgi:hypothetical protein